jgi:Domain of unknown function (DUF3472)/Domain of unknown function (DUF5077)
VISKFYGLRLIAFLGSGIVAILLTKLAGLSAAESSTAPQAARSVHLWYPAPDATLFYNEMVVEKSTGGSYFMACGWDKGYFGIQELGDGRKVILFSVWDAGDAEKSKIGAEERVECLYQAPDAKVRRFGGEGTGGQCMRDFKWMLAETNRFLVKAEVEGEKTSYTGYVYVADKKEWKRLVTFRVRTGGTPLRGLYSFVEDFRRDTKSATDVRQARYGNGWVQLVNGDWRLLNQARFTASNSSFEAKDTIDAGFDGACFYLVTGGQTQMKAKLSEMIRGSESKGSEHPQGLPREDR